jgi:hypothetical protein
LLKNCVLILHDQYMPTQATVDLYTGGMTV